MKMISVLEGRPEQGCLVIAEDGNKNLVPCFYINHHFVRGQLTPEGGCLLSGTVPGVTRWCYHTKPESPARPNTPFTPKIVH